MTGSINSFLDGGSILVTGGTGSFGQKLINTILQEFQPRRLIIYSRDELKQFEMQQLYSPKNYPCLRYFLGDVRDLERLKLALRGVKIVFHAAALKHVTAAEYNPTECIHTNVNGAENLVMACIESGVERLIALSTDKACNPINLYGASKLAADKIFLAANQLSGEGGTQFACVRYGNVVGSRGSVIPYFKRLIENGNDSLPITDIRMTRFWITVQSGVRFVLSCLSEMRGGEIFIPKIPSMKVTDLASAIAPDLKHEVIGIRPGEKLHEVMFTEDDARSTVELSDRYIIEPSPIESPNYLLRDTAMPVSDGFRYSSETNSHWLDAEGIRELIALSD